MYGYGMSLNVCFYLKKQGAEYSMYSMLLYIFSVRTHTHTHTRGPAHKSVCE